MGEMLNGLWRIPRDLISDGYDQALDALSRQLPMTIHEYPTGARCWTWIVPEKWTCHEAYLETIAGKRLFSYQDHPLHVVSYSLPFEGEVTREELFQHLHVHPTLPEAIPAIFKYYERDWGLCLSQRMKESLRDPRYRVVIRSSFRYGALKVGEVIVPGESQESFVLCAHLCHPAMANDDLAGVVVGMEVMRALMKRRPRYTYRFLIVPETIGSVAYLSHHEELIPKFKGGLFLEMLGLDQPHGLQLSLEGNTEVDRCLTLALNEQDPHGWTGAFRTIIQNDERQFNAPGVRVPMLSLSRVFPPSDSRWPYPEYHSSFDTPRIVSVERLQESRDLVLHMIDVWEANTVPTNQFKGEIFCSRYGVNVEWLEDREGNKHLRDVMYLIDGTRSLAHIAQRCGLPFHRVKETVESFRRHGLVRYADDAQ